KDNDNIIENLGNFTNLVNDWNKVVFGNIFDRKREVIRELDRVQQALEQGNSIHLPLKETDIRVEIENILNQEELLWF
ncbi:hypothetical protein ES319_A01G067800v1, partial [Gossypium barbadense]